MITKQIKFRFLTLFYIKYKNLGISLTNLKGLNKVNNIYPTLFQIKCPSKESRIVVVVVLVLVRKEEEKSNLLTNTIMTREAAM